MKTASTALVTLLAVLVTPQEVPETYRREANEDDLTKQINILELLSHTNKKDLFKNQSSVGDNYGNNVDVRDYQQPEVIQRLLNNYNHGLLLQRGEVFSLLNEVDAKQVDDLFEMFIGAKDYDTFYKAASWARGTMNGGVFIAALSSAVLHRDDTSDCLLPPTYETNPNLFTSVRIIQEAVDAHLTQEETPVVISYSPDDNLKYFTEDPELGNYNIQYIYEYPFWMANITRRGELFLYTRKQILAYYNLHRLSLGLPKVEPFVADLTYPIQEGYFPYLRYPNGVPMTGRPAYATAAPSAIPELEELKAVIKRIEDAIDDGTFVASEGGDLYKTERVFLRDMNVIDALGSMMEGNKDSLNIRSFESIHQMLMRWLGHPVNTDVPGSTENFETTLRDPVYYAALQLMFTIISRYTDRLSSYSTEELTIPELMITSVDVDPLVTNIGYFNYSLNNAISVANQDDLSDLDIKVKQPRLSHEPYNMNITVSSDSNTTIPTVVRIYLLPKHDWEGRELSLESARQYAVEVDRFRHHIQPGENVISRSSKESTAVAPDPPSTESLISQVADALQGNEPFYVDQRQNQCAFPEHLLLPRGNPIGLPMMLFVVISAAGEEEPDIPAHRAIISCGPGIGHEDLDDKPLGYPFDRPIRDSCEIEDTPNIFMKDVLIYHAA